VGAHIWSTNNGFSSNFHFNRITDVESTYRGFIIHQFCLNHDSHDIWALLSEEVKQESIARFNCALLMNIICRSIKYENILLVFVIALIELATALMCIAMHNFSLALVTAVVYVPIVFLITPHHESASR